jgi:hypothetical protein
MNVVIFTAPSVDFSKLISELKSIFKAEDLELGIMHPNAADKINVAIVPIPPIQGDADALVMVSNYVDKRRALFIRRICQSYFQYHGLKKIMFVNGSGDF